MLDSACTVPPSNSVPDHALVLPDSKPSQNDANAGQASAGTTPSLAVTPSLEIWPSASR
jgi:hypothetical protein